MYRILGFINRNTKDFRNSLSFKTLYNCLIMVNLGFVCGTTLHIIVNLTMFRINF